MTSTTTNGTRTINDIGVGLISVGWMGKLHSRAYQAVPYVYPETGIRPRLVHAADTAPDRVVYAREVLGYERGSSDWREVLADPDVDVVSICAPNVLHREIGVAAAEAGKHFWIEKPVGRTVKETAAVAAAARAAGLVTSIGYNYRHAPAVEHSRELVASGALGRITNVRAVFFAGYAAEPKGALSWRFKRELAGSGALGDLFSHVVDLVQYVVGPVAEVTALTSTVYTERPVLPMGSATHFAVIEHGELGPVENEDYLGFELYGTDGSLAWNFEQMNELRVCLGRGGPHQGYTTVLANHRLGDYGRFQPGPGIAMGYDDLKVIEAKKFLVAVTGGERQNCSVDDALLAAEVVAAAERSAADGSWQEVPPVPGVGSGRVPASAPGSSHG
jgi:predicted dehydrogenase